MGGAGRRRSPRPRSRDRIALLVGHAPPARASLPLRERCRARRDLRPSAARVARGGDRLAGCGGPRRSRRAPAARRGRPRRGRRGTPSVRLLARPAPGPSRARAGRPQTRPRPTRRGRLCLFVGHAAALRHAGAAASCWGPSPRPSRAGGRPPGIAVHFDAPSARAAAGGAALLRRDAASDFGAVPRHRQTDSRPGAAEHGRPVTAGARETLPDPGDVRLSASSCRSPRLHARHQPRRCGMSERRLSWGVL